MANHSNILAWRIPGTGEPGGLLSVGLHRVGHNWSNLAAATCIPDHLTCLLRNLYASQETTVRTQHRKTDWFQIGKGVHRGCILSPCLFTYMQSTSWETLDWKKHKLKSRVPGEISITSDMQMTPPLGQKVKTLDESERREWKCWLKAQHSEN